MKKLLFILFIAVGTASVFGQVNDMPCITCDGNRVDFNKGASAIGTQNQSMGINSLAVGFQNISLGNYSLSAGYKSNAFGDYSMAFGKTALSNGIQSFAFGLLSEALGNASLAIGSYTLTTDAALLSIALGSKVSAFAERNIALGYGLYNDPIENNISNSLMAGFNSNRPTFFISPSAGIETTGKIGIGNITAPTAKLHIRADENEDATLKLDAPETNKVAKLILADDDNAIIASSQSGMRFYTTDAGNFNFINGRVGIGIGTSTPSQTLDVEGTLRVSSLSSTTTKMIVSTTSGTLSTMNIPAGDNLGNHIATQNLNLNGKYLSGDGSSNGLFIDAAGDVGIGTNTPGEKLEVVGTIKATTFSGDGSLLTNLTGDNLGNHTATQNINLNGKYLSGDGDAEGLYINSLGQIGIGTNTPAAKIQINGGGNDVLARYKTGSNSFNIGRAISGAGLGVWGTTYIGFNLRREANNLWKTEYDGASNGGAMIYGTFGGDLIFTCIGNDTYFPEHQQLSDEQIKVNTKMILRSDGLLKANEIVVKTDVWSDYVLQDDYPLPELADVAEFILKNRHLPDVPSEAEVIEEGINLGQMDAILLKKTEELTLYVIDLKKRTRRCAKRLKNLKNSSA